MLVAERQRRRWAAPAVPPSLTVPIQVLEALLKDLDQETRQWVRESPLWREQDNLLQSFRGIGDQPRHTLLATLPELGHLPDPQLAALVGVAPMTWDSGTQPGQRHIRGGRDDVRRMRSLATLAALRCNPLVRQRYQRWCAAGKVRTGALVACMHQGLCLLNRTVWHRRPVGSASGQMR